MPGKLVSLFGIAAALFLAGCTVTSSLVPPFDEKTSLPPQEFYGNWVCRTDSDTYNIAVSPLRNSQDSILIQIVQTPGKQQKDFNGKWAPLVGKIIKVKEKCFLTATVHIAQIFQDAKYNESAFWMLSPRFYLLQLSRKDDGIDLQFATFATFSNNKWSPVGKTVKLQGGIVLNSTREIQNMLDSGEYALDQKIYHLTRRQTDAGQ